ncbi:hypothetical protein MCCARTNEY_143 [Bacillus phage vB_BanH_McCartney]|nr:hypothetical protein MCCARTNEY_143 [Bacillus phage vB_BanH_McCartney]
MLAIKFENGLYFGGFNENGTVRCVSHPNKIEFFTEAQFNHPKRKKHVYGIIDKLFYLHRLKFDIVNFSEGAVPYQRFGTATKIIGGI